MKAFFAACAIVLAFGLPGAPKATAQDYNLIYYDSSKPDGQHWIVDTTLSGNYMTYSYGTCLDLVSNYQIQGLEAACSRTTDYKGNPVSDWFCNAWGGYDTLSGHDYNIGTVAAFLNIVDEFSWYPTQAGACYSGYDGEGLIAPLSWYYSNQ